MSDKLSESRAPLWTRDFTIITLGSTVSMVGNSMAGFSMSLFVLDYTGSTQLYAIFIAMFTLPMMIMPIFSGAILDRFSRKKAIYTIDFISAALYLGASFLIVSGHFNFPILAVFCFVLGSIESIYIVAYESFYPLLISEGNFSRAYSVASMLETLSAFVQPLSALLYNTMGMGVLLKVNASCFFLAAVMETQIKQQEDYITLRKMQDSAPASGKRLLSDIKEGFAYILSEHGLMAIALYFVFSFLSDGASQVVALPFFKSSFNNGEYIFTVIMMCGVIGRFVGGLIHYRVNLPTNRKYSIALSVYITISVIFSFYLYTPLPIMAVLAFITGLLGVTSYTIRISATQSYVPDEKKGRFNGAFSMLSTTGCFIGEIAAGALTAYFAPRVVYAGFMVITAVAAIIFIGGNKNSVSKIYNRQQ